MISASASAQRPKSVVALNPAANAAAMAASGM
jgi:hypothetical protein